MKNYGLANKAKFFDFLEANYTATTLKSQVYRIDFDFSGDFGKIPKSTK